MSKASKHRECPALKRTITSQECGANRNLTCACTADCLFNPFAPANLAMLVETEEKLDQAILDGLRMNRETRERIEREFRSISFERFEPLLSLLSMETFFRKGPNGQTWAEHWLANGCGDWKNDLQALFAHKARLRARLVEVLEVREGECLIRDLLEPERPAFVLRDLKIASQICRFDTFLALIYDLPFFSRCVAGGVPFVSMGCPALEALMEIARHLGAPTEKDALNVWLVEHLADVADALNATAQARHAKMLEMSDLRFGKAVYALAAPVAECQDALDRVPEVADDALRDSEKREGFLEARAWLEQPPSENAGNEQVVGRVLLGQTHCRVEAMGEERLKNLRARLESALGQRITFEGQRLDDLQKPPSSVKPSRLVPPRLLENLQKIQLQSSRINLARAVRPGENPGEAIMRLADEDFLRMRIPALDNKTPAEAAADPALRPVLIENLKCRINGTDRKNLEDGTSYNPQWMLEQLGITELIGPPPPKRPRLRPAPEEEESLPEDEPFVPPPTPPGRHLAPEVRTEISADEMDNRYSAALARMGNEAALLAEAIEAGCHWFDSAQTCLVLSPNSPESNAIRRALLPTWCALVPVGGFVWATLPEILEEHFEDNLEDQEKSNISRDPEKLDWLPHCPQPQVLHAAMLLLKSSFEAEKIDNPGQFARAAAFLAAAIEELDGALSEQNERCES